MQQPNELPKRSSHRHEIKLRFEPVQFRYLKLVMEREGYTSTQKFFRDLLQLFVNSRLGYEHYGLRVDAAENLEVKS